MADQEVTSRLVLQGDPSGLVAAMEKAEAQIKRFNGMVDSASSTIGKLTGVVGVISGILAGGAMFKNVTEETVKWTWEAMNLSRVLGITTQEASVLNLALGDVYLSTDTMVAASNLLTKSTIKNAEVFEHYGIALKNSNGSQRSTLEIMEDVNAKLLTIKEGRDREIAGMQLYGRGWGEVRDILKLTGEVMDAARYKAEQLHLIVGPEAIAQTKAYKAAMNDVEDIFMALKIQVGNHLLPILTNLGIWLNDIGPTALFLFEGALKGVVTFLHGATLGVQIFWEMWKAVWGQFSVSAVSLVQIIGQIISGDFSGAWQTAKQGWADFNQYGATAMDNIVAKATSTNEQLQILWGLKAPKTRPDKPKPPTGGGDPYDKDAENKAGKLITLEDSRLKSVLAGIKAREDAQKQYTQTYLLEENYMYQSGIVAQTTYMEKKYDLEREGLKKSIDFIGEEISAIEQARDKKLNVEGLKQTDRNKIIEDAKKETADRVAEKERALQQLYQMEVQYNSSITELDISNRDKNRESWDRTRGTMAQTYEARLRYLGDERAALDAHYFWQAMKLDEEYQKAIETAWKTGADITLIQMEYNARHVEMEQEKAQRLADIWWENSQKYVGFAETMTTMGLQMLFFEEGQRDQIGKRMLSTSIRFITQGLQQYMFGKAQEHVLNAAAAAGRTSTDMAAATANLGILEAQAAAWAAFFAAMSLNPYGGQAFIPAATAMTAVAAGAVPAALASVTTIGAASIAAELGMAAAWGAGGILVGALGEAGATAIEGGTTGNSTGYGSGTYSSPVVTQPVSTQQTTQQITVVFQGNVMDQRYVEETVIPFLNDAASRKLNFTS